MDRPTVADALPVALMGAALALGLHLGGCADDGCPDRLRPAEPCGQPSQMGVGATPSLTAFALPSCHDFAEGQNRLQGHLSFEDDNGDIAAWHVQIPDIDVDATGDVLLADPAATAGEANVHLRIVGEPDHGRYDYEAWLTDRAGNLSQPMCGTLRIR